jgi:hypothetical protein
MKERYRLEKMVRFQKVNVNLKKQMNKAIEIFKIQEKEDKQKRIR